MIKSFEFILPTKLIYGAGEIQVLPEELESINAKKIMVIKNKNLPVMHVIEELIKGFDYIIYDDIEQNPKDYNVKNAAEYAKKNNIDTLIGIGGGSVIEAAKAVSILMTNEGEIFDFEGCEKVKNPVTSLIAIPTTAGTGTEMTSSTVIINSKRKVKFTIKSIKIAPKIAIADPELTVSMSSKITGPVGMAAITRAIEGYVSFSRKPFCEALSLFAIDYLSNNIEKVIKNGNDIIARDRMMIGSIMAGISFSYSEVSNVQVMSEALSSKYDLPHGLSNAILLPYVMEYDVANAEKKYARIAEAMGMTAPNDLMTANEGIENIKIIRKNIKIPKLSTLDIKYKDIEEMAETTEKNMIQSSNPRKFTKEDYIKIFQRAYSDSKK